MSPRRPRTPGQSRQKIAQRLRDRRSHEEVLILDVASALARRSAAESALAEAVEALTAALDELQRHGFELNQIARFYRSTQSEISGISSSRRGAVRSIRPDNPLDSGPN